MKKKTNTPENNLRTIRPRKLSVKLLLNILFPYQMLLRGGWQQRYHQDMQHAETKVYIKRNWHMIEAIGGKNYHIWHKHKLKQADHMQNNLEKEMYAFVSNN